MSKSMIYTVNNSNLEVVDGGIIPLGTIIRRYGQNIRQDGNSITVCDKPGCPGYYMAHINATIEPAAGGDVKVILEKDGTPLIGGVAQISPAPATTVLPFPINIPFRNSCGGSSSVAVRLVGDNAKIINMTVVIEKM